MRNAVRPLAFVAAALAVAGMSASVYAVNDLGTAANPTTPTAPSARGTAVQPSIARIAEPTTPKATAHKAKTSAKAPAKPSTRKVAHHAKKPVHKSTHL